MSTDILARNGGITYNQKQKQKSLNLKIEKYVTLGVTFLTPLFQVWASVYLLTYCLNIPREGRPICSHDWSASKNHIKPWFYQGY